MSHNTETDPLYLHFSALIALPEQVRFDALAALPVDANLRARLSQMLAADQQTGGIETAIFNAAHRSIAHIESGHIAAGPISGSISGSILGDYRILHELGHGGMGTVFLAERADAQYQTQVAIKLLRGFPTNEGMRRLKQERQILAQLDHPNIARLIDGGQTSQGQPFLVMEFVPGQTLNEYLRTASPTVAACLALFDKLLNAVEHAHQHLIIHRDIKPSNVLIRDDGEPKLLDFGVAKLLDLDSESQRQTSTRVWSEGYASPEQQRGELITVASDVFSLGVVLKEMLRAAPTKNFPADLISVLTKATHIEAPHRYPTVAMLREDLQRFNQGLPVHAARASFWYHSLKFARRNRWQVLIGAAALLLSATLVWRLNEERQRAVQAETQARTQTQQAKASRDFVVSLFQNANPINGKGENVTALELLEQGRAKALDALIAEPELRAEMLEQLAQAYLGLSQFDTALAMAKEATELTPGNTLLHYQRAHVQNSALVRAARFTEALAATDALAAKAVQYGMTDAGLRVSMLNTRVMALTNLGRGPEAILDLKTILTLLPSVGSKQAEQRAYELDNLSWAYKVDGDFVQAIRYAREAREAFSILRGTGSLEPLNVQRHLATLLFAVGDPQAVPLLEATLFDFRKILNKNHVKLTTVQTNLAFAYLRSGAVESAEQQLTEASSRCASAWPSCVQTLLALGQLQVAKGQREVGIASIEQVLALQIADVNVPELVRDRTRLALAIARCASLESSEVVALKTGFLKSLLVSEFERQLGTTALDRCRISD